MGKGVTYDGTCFCVQVEGNGQFRCRHGRVNRAASVLRCLFPPGSRRQAEFPFERPVERRFGFTADLLGNAGDRCLGLATDQRIEAFAQCTTDAIPDSLTDRAADHARRLSGTPRRP